MHHVVEGSDGKELDTNEGSSDVEPYVGMECDSEEAAKVFYDAYATRLGFIMRVDAFRRSMRDGKVVWRRLVCNKEGFRKLRPRRSENRKPRAITREGCKAMIVVKKETSGKWVVTRFVKEHNHPLVAAPANGRRSVLLSQTPDEKDVKIRELTAELQRERKRCAAYQEQLAMILRDMEEHSNHLSRNIDDVVQSVREFEARRDFARRAEKRNHENDTTSKKMSKSPCMVLLSLETKPSPMNTGNVKREFALITSSSSAFE